MDPVGEVKGQLRTGGKTLDYQALKFNTKLSNEASGVHMFTLGLSRTTEVYRPYINFSKRETCVHINSRRSLS